MTASLILVPISREDCRSLLRAKGKTSLNDPLWFVVYREITAETEKEFRQHRYHITLKLCANTDDVIDVDDDRAIQNIETIGSVTYACQYENGSQAAMVSLGRGPTTGIKWSNISRLLCNVSLTNTSDENSDEPGMAVASLSLCKGTGHHVVYLDGELVKLGREVPVNNGTIISLFGPTGFAYQATIFQSVNNEETAEGFTIAESSSPKKRRTNPPMEGEKRIFVMDILTDENICDIATFCTPHDLVSLGRTCTYFGGSHPEDGQDKAERSEAVELVGRGWSLINEAARNIVEKGKDDIERWKDSHLSERMTEKVSLIAVYWRLYYQWKTHLLFAHFTGNAVQYVQGDISHVQFKKPFAKSVVERFYAVPSLAVCQELMKTGRHYAEFTIILPNGGRGRWRGNPIGVMSNPIGLTTHCSDVLDWENSSVKVVHGIPDTEHCDPDYEQGGMVIGLLLDLDAGTLTSFIKGKSERLHYGGLRGPYYSWAAFPSDCTVKIQRQQAPIAFPRSVRVSPAHNRDGAEIGPL
jgi:hypothetical protein